jgi:hypothetical protein
LCADLLVSRRGRLLTAGSGNSVRLWSVVSINELKLTAQNTVSGSDSATGVVLEDEMTLDAPAVSVAFDDSLDMVNTLLSVVELTVCELKVAPVRLGVVLVCAVTAKVPSYSS